MSLILKFLTSCYLFISCLCLLGVVFSVAANCWNLSIIGPALGPSLFKIWRWKVICRDFQKQENFLPNKIQRYPDFCHYLIMWTVLKWRLFHDFFRVKTLKHIKCHYLRNYNGRILGSAKSSFLSFLLYSLGARTPLRTHDTLRVYLFTNANFNFWMLAAIYKVKVN